MLYKPLTPGPPTAARAESTFLSVALSLVLFAAAALAENRTWIEIDEVTYGARPDERGPIGGGDGYAAVVSEAQHTARTIDELIDALTEAQAGQTVFIPGDIELDLTARIYIEKLVLEVPPGVTLASDRGRNGSAGALLTSDALATPMMIRPAGADVRITGLRLRGPNPKQYLDHHRRSFAEGRGHEYYCKLPTSAAIVTDHDRLEVDNCEISGFSHGGIYLAGGAGHHVHHTFIHHCQYQGLGYGIVLDAAEVLIEYNLFSFNRHSIAGTGRPGSGYEASNNVELGTSSHCFDMHGGRDRGDGTDIAGTAIRIHHNTFRARTTPVVIRGVPEDVCDVHHNWFPQHGPGDAVHAGQRTQVHDNAHGAGDEVRLK